MKPLTLKNLLIAGIFLMTFGCTGPGHSNHSRKIDIPAASSPVAVWLIPLDDFPYAAASDLAKALSNDLHINVRSTLNAGSKELKPIGTTTQYSANDMLQLVEQIIPTLHKSTTNTAYIMLTTRDINAENSSVRFLFSQVQFQKRIAVVSSARMAVGVAPSQEGNTLILSRLYKMLKKQIGYTFYGLKASSDINDVMYSPIMNLETLDKMGTKYLHQ